MNLESLAPTDSLYKFMAIAGLVLLVFGASYPLARDDDLRSKNHDVALQLNEVQRLVAQFSVDVDSEARRAGIPGSNTAGSTRPASSRLAETRLETAEGELETTILSLEGTELEIQAHDIERRSATQPLTPAERTELRGIFTDWKNLLDEVDRAKGKSAAETTRVLDLLHREADIDAKVRESQILTKEEGSLLVQAQVWESIGRIMRRSGYAVSVLGFWLWYIRLQRPQDRLVLLRLDAARDSGATKFATAQSGTKSGAEETE
jgi:hypothetical protein